MEQQQNDSAETDAEIEQLSKRIAVFDSFKEQQQNNSTKTDAEIEHSIKVVEVSDLIMRYLFEQYCSLTKKRRIMETIMAILPNNPLDAEFKHLSKVVEVSYLIMRYHFERYYSVTKKRRINVETIMSILPNNPLAASHPKDPQGAFTSRKITLKSSDGEVEVDKEVALESQTMKYAIEHNCADIRLPEVTSKILSKVIEYCKKHVESCKSDDRATGAVDDDLKAWDAKFVKVDQATLFNLIRAAHYLDIKSLSELTCKAFVDMCEGKTREECYKTIKLLMHPV